jgi:tetratricopeptide (TPR) repeat protein
MIGARALLALLLLTAPAACAPAFADAKSSAELDKLFAQLRDPAVGSNVLRIEPMIWEIWMHGGSHAENERLAKAAAAMNAAAYDDALEMLDALVRDTPDFPEVWNKRATLYFLMGRYDESLADIVKTLELEPRHFGALSGRGMIYQRQGKDAEALAAYKDALTVHPQLLGARLMVKQLEKVVPEL